MNINTKRFGKQSIVLIVLSLIVAACSKEKVRIPDVNFEQALIKKGLDTKQDGFIVLNDKIAETKTLDISDNEIGQLTGIEYFTNLEDLNCSNNQLEMLDVSKNKVLKTLKCQSNKIKILNVSNNQSLTDLNCAYNRIDSLDLSKNQKLIRINCEKNYLTSLNLKSNKYLQELYCSGQNYRGLLLKIGARPVAIGARHSLQRLNQSTISRERSLTFLDLTGNLDLKVLDCQSNNISTLDISKNVALVELNCSNNNLTTLNLIQNRDLQKLGCNSNKLESLDVGSFELTILDCSYNRIKDLSFPKSGSLRDLNCFNNQIKTLDLRLMTGLEFLYCAKNQITELDIYECRNLINLESDNTISDYKYLQIFVALNRFSPEKSIDITEKSIDITRQIRSDFQDIHTICKCLLGLLAFLIIAKIIKYFSS